MAKNNYTFIIFSPAFPANENEDTWLPSLQGFVRAINRNYPGLQVIIFAFQYPQTTKTYTWFGNKVLPVNGWYKSKPAKLLAWLKILFEIKKIKKQNSIIGIFSQWCTECTLAAKYISSLLNIKQLCWIVGQDARAGNPYIKYIRPKPSSLVALSDFIADEFFKNYGIRPGYIVPKGIDTSMFGAPQKKDIDIIGVGSLSVLKQYDVFIKTIASVKKDLPFIQTVLCGDGEDRKHLEAMIKELNLAENIIVKGAVPHSEVLALMQRSKILLHPSSYEGFGTVCLEALYAGAHVISIVQPMYREIQHWHIVKSVDEMQNKVMEILSGHGLKFEPVLPYSSDESAKKILQLFSYYAPTIH